MSGGWATTGSLDGAVTSRVQFSRLTVLAAPGDGAVGRMRILDTDSLDLGRGAAASAELGLADASLSRRHLRLEHRADGWWARDLGSRHGTRADGAAVHEVRLDSGAVLRLGRSLLLFEEISVEQGTPLGAEEAPLWGPSYGLQRVRGHINRVAPERIPVLIQGETGVGKEVAARAIHDRSGRAGAFVAVNCGALPRDLVERELFGHRRGAFTGADRPGRGLFQEADGGTLFLDEIGELPLELQPRLLRALSEGEVRPVGASKAEPVDVRVLAATHRDLEEAVAQGTFREDLLSRLAGWTLRIPPLRERRADVLALARRFLGDSATLSADAAEALLLHPWPRNVRELRAALEAARIGRNGSELRLEHLPEVVRGHLAGLARSAPAPSGIPIELLVRPDLEPTAADLRRVLDHHDGNVSRVADFFGKDRKQVYRWMKRYALSTGRHDADSTESR